jgi:hypothetical protein
LNCANYRILDENVKFLFVLKFICQTNTVFHAGLLRIERQRVCNCIFCYIYIQKLVRNCPGRKRGNNQTFITYSLTKCIMYSLYLCFNKYKEILVFFLMPFSWKIKLLLM